MGDQAEIEKLNYSELLLNEVNMIVSSCDINGNITYISPATEKIIGFKIDNLLKEEGETFNESSLLSLLIKSFNKEIEDFIAAISIELKNKN